MRDGDIERAKGTGILVNGLTVQVVRIPWVTGFAWEGRVFPVQVSGGGTTWTTTHRGVADALDGALAAARSWRRNTGQTPRASASRASRKRRR